MRIAIYHHLPPGGALRSVVEVIKRFPADVECDVFTLDSSRWWPFPPVGPQFRVPHEVDAPMLAPGPLGSLGAGGRLLGLLARLDRAEQQVADKINAGRYDAVLVHPCWLTQTPSIMRRLDGPVVYYMHEPRRSSFESGFGAAQHRHGVTRLLARVVGTAIERRLRNRDALAAQRPELVLCNSYFSAESIKRAYGIDARVSYLGVDAQVFRPSSQDCEPEATDALPAVLCVGGFEPFKGQHLVASALALLPHDRRPVLRLVYERCDETYRRKVLAQCAQDRVLVEEHRGLGDVELAQLYSSSVATVLVASLEPFGLTMLESMAAGTPVIAVREGGYREVVQEGTTGVMVDRSIDEIAAAIDELVTSRFFDPAAVREQVLSQWTWDAATQRQLDAVRSALSGA